MSEGVITDVYIYVVCTYTLYPQNMSVCVCAFPSLCIWQHTSAAVYQTAGLIYQRQAACAAFHWFRRNAVTCGDIGLSVCSPVCFCLPLASACWIQLVLTLFFSLLGFPNEPAADIALNTVKSWIEENPDKVGHARVMHIQNK